MELTRALRPSKWLTKKHFRQGIRRYNLLDVAGSSSPNHGSSILPAQNTLHVYTSSNCDALSWFNRQEKATDIAVTFLASPALSAETSVRKMCDFFGEFGGQISELSFVGCLNSPVEARGVLENLPAMPRLTALSIEDCRLSRAGAGAVGESVMNMKHLKRLHIGNSHVPIDALNGIFEKLAYLGHFESFTASQLLPSADIQRFLSVLPHLPWLEELHFQDCFFSPEQVQDLGAAVGQCQRVQSFGLNRCGLDGASGALLRRGLQQAAALAFLDVSNNESLGGKGLSDLAAGARNMHMLHSLKMQQCNAGQAGVQAASEAILASRGLRDVHVGDHGASLDVRPLARAIESASSSMHPWHGLGIHANEAQGTQALLRTVASTPSTYVTGDAILASLIVHLQKGMDGTESELLDYLNVQQHGLRHLELVSRPSEVNFASIMPTLTNCQALERLTVDLSSENAAAVAAGALRDASGGGDIVFPNLNSIRVNLPISSDASDKTCAQIGQALGGLPRLAEVELLCSEAETSLTAANSTLQSLLAAANAKQCSVDHVTVNWSPTIQTEAFDEEAPVAMLDSPTGSVTFPFATAHGASER